MIPFGTGNTDINPSIEAGIAEEGGILIYDISRKFWEGSNRLKVSPSATTFYNDAGTEVFQIEDSEITVPAGSILRTSSIKSNFGNMNFYADNFNVYPFLGGSIKFRVDGFGTVRASDGSGIENLNASYLASGTINNVLLPPTISVTTLEGAGSGITDLNATNISSGTINNGRLPSTISQTNLYGDSGVFNSVGTDLIRSGGLSFGSPVIPVPPTNTNIVYASDTHTFMNYAGSSTYATLNSTGLTLDQINFNTLGSGDWAKLYTEGTVDDEGYEDNGHRLVLELGDDEVDPAEFIIRRHYDSEVLFVVDGGGSVSASGSLNAGIINATTGVIGILTASTKVLTNLIEAQSGSTITMGDTTTFNDGFRPNGSTYNIVWNAGLGRIQSLDPWKIGGLFVEAPASSTAVPFTMKQNNATQPLIALFSDDSSSEIMSVNETNVSIPTKSLNFGNSTRQMINLWTTAYGIGVQASTQYFRTDDHFAWYKGGVHNDTQFNAGGGTAQMVLNGSGRLGIGTTSPTYTLDINGQINVVYNSIAGFRTFAQDVSGVATAYLYSVDGSASRTNYPYFRFRPASGSTHGNITVFGFGSDADFCLGDGNLGVGTETPNRALHVANGGVNLNNGGTGYLMDASATYETSTFIVKRATTHSFNSADNITSFAHLNASGLGVGTTAPEAKLHIETSALSATAGQSQLGLSVKMPSINNDRILFYNYRVSTGFDWTTAIPTIARVVDTTYHNYIRFDGNYTRMGDFRYGGEFSFDNVNSRLGIGRLNPSYKLDVNGSIRGGDYLYDANNRLVLQLTADGAWYRAFQSSITNGVAIYNGISINGGGFICGNFDSANALGNGNGYFTGTLKVGITRTALARLEVGSGTNSTTYDSARYFRHNVNVTNGPSVFFGGVSIFADDDIISKQYIVSHAGTMSASDSRIKENIEDISDTEALDTLRLLKPKTYTYKDTIKRGTEKVIGFIAQEVEEVLPLATGKRYDTIPNIYELANVSASNVLTFTNFNTSNLTANTVIDAKTETSGDMRLTIEEVIDEHSIKVKEDIDGEQVFIMGEYVNDFTFLKKDHIWTVATSALQEVDRQQQADKARIATLEGLVQTLMEEVAVLKAQGTPQTAS